MKRYIVIHQDKLINKDVLLNEAVRLWKKEDTLEQSEYYVLRLNSENEESFREYIKYTEEHIKEVKASFGTLQSINTPIIDLSDKSAVQKAIPVIIHKPEDTSFARCTHDFCDKTTWYTNSVRVEGESLSGPNGLTYTLQNDYVIDVVNGKTNRQDTLQEFAVIVYDDGEIKTDYTIDHRNGTVTLLSALSGTGTIDYSYATTSEWVLQPVDGSILIIEHAEVQFALNVQITSPLRFEIWVYNPYYGAIGHPYEHMLKVPYQIIQYNSVKDLVNEANLGTGTIPAMDGLPECVVFPFNYASIKPFKSSQGAELRVKAASDEEIGGSFGTATFYILSRPEE